MPRLIKRIAPRKLIALSIAAVLVLACFVGGGYFLRTRYVKYRGIDITPTRDYPVRHISYYLQNDPEWSSDAIGHSGYSMGSSGCLVSSAATAMTELGVVISPKELNWRLTLVDGYQDGDLIWYKLNEAIPEINYRYKRLFSGRDLDRDLEQGLLPIVKVYYMGTRIQHWVLVVGAEDGEYYVCDPLNREMEPIPLSTHGKVYAYRVLELSA